MKKASLTRCLGGLLLLGIGVSFALLLKTPGTQSLSARGTTGSPNFSLTPAFSDPTNALTKAYFIFAGHPGDQLTNGVRVTNDGTGRGTITLYAVDAITGQTSGTSFLNRADGRHDVGAWVTLSHENVTLDPHTSQVILFHLAIPLQVRPGQHAGGIIAEMATQSLSASSSANIGVQHRFALGVLVNLPGHLSRHLAATDIHNDDRSQYQRVLIGLHNTGTQLLHPHGTLEVSDAAEHPLLHFALTLDTFLPQTAIDYPVYIPHHPLAPGTYHALLRLFYEQNQVLLYRTTFQVASPVIIHPTKTFSGVVNALSTAPFSPFSLGVVVLGILVLLLAAGGSYFFGKTVYRVVNNRLHVLSNKKKTKQDID